VIGTGHDVVLTGCISLAQRLLALRMRRRTELFVHPVVIAAERRLFTAEHELRDLTLVESRSFEDGAVLLRSTA